MQSTLDSDELYRLARDTIESAQLSAIEHLQLGVLLINAISKDDTARLILNASQKPGESIEDSLRSINRSFKSLAQRFLPNDLVISPKVYSAIRKRDNSRCFVSGSENCLQATYIVPPSILDDPDLLPGGELRPYLEAVISPETSRNLFSFIECRSQEHQLKNLWLMSQPISSAFQDGRISVSKICTSSKIYWNIRKHFYEDSEIPGLLDDHFYTEPSSPDETGLPLPEAFLLDIQKTFSSIRYLQLLEGEIQQGWPELQKSKQWLEKVIFFTLRGCISVLPVFLKSAAYNYYIKAMGYVSHSCASLVTYLPLGLCLKFGTRVSRNEANTLRLIEKHTKIPAPKFLDFVQEKNGVGFLLMTTVPGIPAEKVIFRMTYEEREQLARDVGKCVSQYRRIKNCNKNLICDTLGGPVTDHRTDDVPSGPYISKAAFLNELTEGLDELKKKCPLSLLYDKEHEICFTHSDLHLSNLLLENGKLSGIVDWENAGFKPEYWDYTKAVWGFMSNERFARQMRLAFDKNYEDELEAERLLWRLKPVY
ncbi:hypothetical protein LOZ58_002746 [Ophidiomyces ophidiicola]|nr:hypothetical protein LOZ58_002746 [Ophidiomyces ophidiicola]